MPRKFALVIISKIRSVYNIELHIARERDKLAIHFKKWEKLVVAITDIQ